MHVIDELTDIAIVPAPCVSGLIFKPLLHFGNDSTDLSQQNLSNNNTHTFGEHSQQ